MPQFAFLLYGPAPGDGTQTPPAEMEAHMAFGDKLAELGGTLDGAQALLPSTEGRAVTKDEVKTGTFLGGDQVLVGFGILDAKDIDHAVEIAKENPATWRGGIEIRPLFVPPAD
jgi:hypothetical protein